LSIELSHPRGDQGLSVALNPRPDGVRASTPNDIAEYYLANYCDQVKSWIAERNAQTAS
jgi:hypothetical protein